MRDRISPFRLACALVLLALSSAGCGGGVEVVKTVTVEQAAPPSTGTAKRSGQPAESLSEAREPTCRPDVRPVRCEHPGEARNDNLRVRAERLLALLDECRGDGPDRLEPGGASVL